MKQVIAKVRYVDTAYTTIDMAATIPTLTMHEAYGYVTITNQDVLLEFICINTLLANLQRTLDALVHRCLRTIVKGLVLPRGAVVGVATIATCPQLSLLKKNTVVSIEWRDVVYLANVKFRPSHVMHSKGLVYDVRSDSVVLYQPETRRMSPLPHGVHAEGAVYMTIPLALITHVEVCI